MKKETKKQRIRKLVQDLCLMDDIFMTTFFDGELELTQYVLSIILG